MAGRRRQRDEEGRRIAQEAEAEKKGTDRVSGILGARWGLVLLAFMGHIGCIGSFCQLRGFDIRSCTFIRDGSGCSELWHCPRIIFVRYFFVPVVNCRGLEDRRLKCICQNICVGLLGRAEYIIVIITMHEY